MVPCPWYNEMADWYKQHPDYDLGLHLAMNSEWKWYRWGPVAGRDKVPGMVDTEGCLWREQIQTARSAKPGEVEAEIRAQIERALAKGTRPGHIDTHMGTLYVRLDFTKAYLKVAEEYRIPAMVVEQSPRVVAKFKKQGYPITDESIKLLATYKLPKLDDFHSVLEGKTYEEKRQKFYDQIRDFQPGLNEIIFHPSVLSDTLQGHHRHLAAARLGSPDVRRPGGESILRARRDRLHELERDHEALGRTLRRHAAQAEGCAEVRPRSVESKK